MLPAQVKKILITGAGGMLGTDLVACLENNCQIFGVGKFPAPHLKVPYHIAELTDSLQVNRIVQEVKPDVIFHCAAMVDVDGCEKNPSEAFLANNTMAQIVAKAAKEIGAFLIFFSTDYVFDGFKTGAYLETDSINPLSEYGRSKAAAEEYLLKSAMPFAIFRISWLYGYHGKSFPRTIWEKSFTQKEFHVVDDQIGSPTYTVDLARAFSQLFTTVPDCLDKMSGQIFHLTNSGHGSWAEIAAFVVSRSPNSDVRIIPIKSDQFNSPTLRPKNSLLSLDKAKEILGLQLRPWQEAMGEFLKSL